MKHTFEATAKQKTEFEDGSGETAIWTDGLMVSSLDHPQDNLTPVKLESGKKYKVTVTVEEILSQA